MACITGAGLVLLLLSAPLSLVSRYEDGLTSEVRFQIWHDTLVLAANYPLFGCGLGTFVSGIQKYLSFAPPGLVDFAREKSVAASVGHGMRRINRCHRRSQSGGFSVLYPRKFYGCSVDCRYRQRNSCQWA